MAKEHTPGYEFALKFHKFAWLGMSLLVWW